eukprot:3729688-Prymnesium_polylepis.1
MGCWRCRERPRTRCRAVMIERESARQITFRDHHARPDHRFRAVPVNRSPSRPPGARDLA